MTQAEHAEYNSLTEGMEMDFIALSESFLGYCEEIIFGNDFPDIKYYCFHLYNDNYTSGIFLRLSYRIEKLYQKIDQIKFPDLSHGLANLLIYLKEPILREQDKEYKAENYRYWLEVIRQDPDLVIKSNAFRKYLTAI